ncbi:MAG: DUF4418 family protein [Deltaproteobacteria bacterium]|nr:DUF4418 family protein [Deltaproteobacteria bacterium]
MAKKRPSRVNKNARVLGTAIGCLGVLIIVVPWIIFPVCGVGRYAPPPGQSIGHHGCHGTLDAETVIGVITIIAGLVAIILPRKRVVFAVSISVMLMAVLVVLFPAAITGVCKMSTMPCRLGTVPALYSVAILMGVTGSLGLWLSRKNS